MDAQTNISAAASNIPSRCELIEALSAHEFVIADLKLFLDTHPCDSDALSAYRKCVKEAGELRTRYEAFYGPLQAESYQPDESWAWICNPWPWDRTCK